MRGRRSTRSGKSPACRSTFDLLKIPPRYLRFSFRYFHDWEVNGESPQLVIVSHCIILRRYKDLLLYRFTIREDLY